MGDSDGGANIGRSQAATQGTSNEQCLRDELACAEISWSLAGTTGHHARALDDTPATACSCPFAEWLCLRLLVGAAVCHAFCVCLLAPSAEQAEEDLWQRHSEV